MPRTYVTFLAGAAALSGLPLMSGFVSKDEILAHTFAGGGLYLLLWIVGVATAALTAFYTWRMVALTFFGKERFDAAEVHPHESPSSMTTPLMVLAVLSVCGGVLGLPPVLHLPHLLHDWLEPVTHTGTAMLAAAHGGEHAHLSHMTEWILLALGAGIALVFAHLGFHAYREGAEADERLERERPAVARLFGDAWGIDRAYNSFVVQPVRLIAFGVSVVIDQFIIDGLVNGSAAFARSLGARLRKTVDGDISTYGLWMGGAALGMALVWMLGRLGA
jgi:NADH-quinone oxidoreductase subunit L